MMEAEQEERRLIDPWEPPIAAFVERQAALGQNVTIAEILDRCIGKRVGDLDRKDEMRAADILRALGWRKGARSRSGGVRVYPWLAPLPEQAELPVERDPGEDG